MPYAKRPREKGIEVSGCGGAAPALLVEDPVEEEEEEAGVETGSKVDADDMDNARDRRKLRGREVWGRVWIGAEGGADIAGVALTVSGQ